MLKGYGEYKKTEIPWLQDLPAHWHSLRAKTMYRKMNRPVDENDDVVTCFRDGTVTLRKNRRTTGFTESIKEIGYQGVKKGDLVIHVMDAFAGAIGVSDSNGKGTPVYTVCTAKGDYNNNYYAFVIREMAIKGFVQSLYRGIRERSSDFRYEVFGKQLLPVPPRPEQDQIVRYLDWKVTMINKYISAKKKQIELLKERKQAIINQVVTKGLDPKVPMKDSGIDWLGKIPAHWEVKQLSRVANVILSGLDKKSYLGEKNVRLCNYVDVYHNDFIHNNMDFMDATASENEYTDLLLKKGDVIITKDSESWNDIAVPAIVIQDLVNICCGYHLAILRCKESCLDPFYLYYLFQARFVEIQQKLRAKGVIRFSLGYQPIHDTNIIIPPLSDQSNIVTHLKKNIENINQSISITTNEVQFIQEYRVRLVSDVVTGKVNVQNIRVPESESNELSIVKQEYEGGVIDDE